VVLGGQGTSREEQNGRNKQFHQSQRHNMPSEKFSGHLNHGLVNDPPGMLGVIDTPELLCKYRAPSATVWKDCLAWRGLLKSDTGPQTRVLANARPEVSESLRPGSG